MNKFFKPKNIEERRRELKQQLRKELIYELNFKNEIELTLFQKMILYFLMLDEDILNEIRTAKAIIKIISLWNNKSQKI